METSLSQADVETSAHAISISFTNSSNATALQLQISSKQLDWQLSSMAQVCDQFSPFLFRVNNLELICAFGGARDFRVAGVHATDILCALRPASGTDIAVLPTLHNLSVEKPMVMDGPSWDAVQLLIASRWLSGRPVQVSAREYPCQACYSSFKWQQEIKAHLVDRHTYRIVCSYCGNFEWSPGYSRQLFREHLQSKHPEVARNAHSPPRLSYSEEP
jgi:hypothetical protein